MTEQQLRHIVREELERIGTGSLRSPSKPDESGPALPDEASKFLERVANGVGDYLSLRSAPYSVPPTDRTWAQVELELYNEGGVTYSTFLTLEREDEDVYRLGVMSDVSASSEGIIDEHEEYLRFRSEDPPGPEDVSSSLLNTVVDMTEDAQMEVQL